MRDWLAEQVEAKVKEGYTVNTYAMDVATADRLKQSLKVQGHEVLHDTSPTDEWVDYLKQVQGGTYKPQHSGIKPFQPVPTTEPVPSSDGASGGVGIWRARRH
jgi:hypothetical protein